MAAEPSWRPDPRGERILTERYWRASGWKPEPERVTPPDEYGYGQRTGYLFGQARLTHDEAVARIIELRKAIAPAAVGAAFADSLASGRLDLRSALGSHGASRNLPGHGAPQPGALSAEGRPVARCPTCRFWLPQATHDLDLWNFYRFKWGGFQNEDVVFAAFDLTRFVASAPQPSDGKGQAILKSMLEAAASLPAQARPGDLLKAIQPVLRGNAYQRRAALAGLAYAGVLQPAGQPGYFDGYPTVRRDPPEWKNDWPYPLSWWRGVDGVNAAAVAVYFPDL